MVIRASRIFVRLLIVPKQNMGAFCWKCDVALCESSISAYRARMIRTIYKIAPRTLWREAERAGAFEGAPIDLQDGFIHFSTGEQAVETAARHFSGQNDLLLIAVDAEALGPALKYELSRGGALFPHLYATLPMAVVKWVRPLPVGADGLHVFGEMEP
jgi:uncharacterized protein (DUF952 family)